MRMGEWRSLHNDELHTFYCSVDIVRTIKFRTLKWAGNVARMRQYKWAFKILRGNPTEKSSLGRPRHRWEDNIILILFPCGSFVSIATLSAGPS